MNSTQNCDSLPIYLPLTQIPIFCPLFPFALLVQSLAPFICGPGSLKSNIPLPKHIYMIKLERIGCMLSSPERPPWTDIQAIHLSGHMFQGVLGVILTIVSFVTELQDNTLRGGQGQSVGCLGPVERVFTHLRWRGLLLTKTLSQQQVSPVPKGGFCKAQR